MSQMSLKRRHADIVEDTAPQDGSADSDIFSSEAIHDRESIFVGYFSPTLTPKALQKHSEVEAASHRILGWRKRTSSQRTISGQPQLETGYDDDGEKYGGKRVLSALENMKVEGSLVVARWYGGVMLGPVRFTHMENAATEAIRVWQQHEAAKKATEARERAEAAEKERLVTELKERDASIVALRKLLDVKSKKKTDEAVETSSQSLASPVKPPMDYVSQPLQRLRMLDKARDSTIGFLLKQIDAAEKTTGLSGKTDSTSSKDKNVSA